MAWDLRHLRVSFILPKYMSNLEKNLVDYATNKFYIKMHF